MVALDLTGFPILLPFAVAPLAVQIERPRSGVDGVNQIVFPETLDVVFVVNRSGVVVMLE